MEGKMSGSCYCLLLSLLSVVLLRSKLCAVLASEELVHGKSGDMKLSFFWECCKGHAGCGPKSKCLNSYKMYIKEQADLIRSTIEHDGCKRFETLDKKNDPRFMLADATCNSACLIVADLHKEEHPNIPRVTVAGECRRSLTLQFKCMCKFYQGLFTWHSLRKTVRHFIDDIIDVDK
ncbi:unnamed protein product [Bemisia tabaci]|uniref:Uncharacterized protein n=1 Tax=Bemisia tabaci TaxID=7038 RepID=A0A9P0G510_BEMTA|nr:unnamed protein product [Bemisia tabaci]